MTASELISLLETVDPDTEVWISADSEGNHFGLLAAADEFNVYADDEPELNFIEDEDVAETDPADKETVVVLWP